MQRFVSLLLLGRGVTEGGRGAETSLLPGCADALFAGTGRGSKLIDGEMGLGDVERLMRGVAVEGGVEAC